MGPITKHVHTVFPELPIACAMQVKFWSFDNAIKTLGPSFYNKLLSLHPMLTLEYSILCNQLHHDLLNPNLLYEKELIDSLLSALMLAELLEQVHFYYLNVPREVVRLRQQQHVFRILLSQVGYSFTVQEKEPIDSGLALSTKVRDNTVFFHVYRMLITRSKRFLNILNTVLIQSELYNTFISYLDRYTNPLFIHLSWVFNSPRLLVNAVLLLKHLIPGEWMKSEEQSLAWHVRFIAQIQRRWFELGNDIIWVGAGVLNAFLLIGVLSPIAFYVSLAAFIFDVVNAIARAYIELKRLTDLRADYVLMLASARDDSERKSILSYLEHLDRRVIFERMRHILHINNMSLTCIAMAVAAPIFALNPIIILVSAAILLVLWLITFILAARLEAYRPSEVIVLPAKPPEGVSDDDSEPEPASSYAFARQRVGFFATQSRINEGLSVKKTVEYPSSLQYLETTY